MAHKYKTLQEKIHKELIADVLQFTVSLILILYVLALVHLFGKYYYICLKNRCLNCCLCNSLQHN